jgi:DNA-binding GntR family transcriptional regulator
MFMAGLAMSRDFGGGVVDAVLDGLGRLERVTLGERVYGELRDLLMAGKLGPGEKLSLRRVAEIVGVSIMPVREAVARLVADGALTVLPNRAVSVPPMTLAKLQELTVVRIEIEGFAAQEAATRRSDAQLEEIRRFDELFRQAVQTKKPSAEKALAMNKELHFAVYRAAGLPSLVAIIEGLWLKVGPVINLDLRSSMERLTSGTAEGHHRRLVAAIAAGDAAAARESLAGDIRDSSLYIQASGALK